jgi:uncharacterized protein (DUF1684 family)
MANDPNNMNKINNFPIVLVISIMLFSCGENYTPEEKEYIESIKQIRNEKDDFMKNNPNSPFNFKGKVEFKPLKYYEPDPAFVFKSKLYEYENKDTVIILGTKGEEREIIKFGFIKFDYKEKEYKINVYQGVSKTGEIYHSIWFTDLTTGNETYGVGRYLDFELNPDKDFIYEIDFNLAYNPYCSYSPNYSCAIPSKEDHIDLAIKAGEKNFH